MDATVFMFACCAVAFIVGEVAHLMPLIRKNKEISKRHNKLIRLHEEHSKTLREDLKKVC